MPFKEKNDIKSDYSDSLISGGNTCMKAEIEDPKEIYECGDCFSSFSEKRLLITHIEETHFPNCYPDVKFEKIEHKQNGSFQCTECFKYFRKSYNLKRHISRFHRNEILKCKYCHEIFKAKENLSRHKRVVHLIKPKVKLSNCTSNQSKNETKNHNYKCNICYKVFELETYLKVHTKNVHLRKNVAQCLKCNKEFKTKSYRDKHMKTVHENSRNFECDICKCTFARKHTLMKHMVRKLKKLEKLKNKEIKQSSKQKRKFES